MSRNGAGVYSLPGTYLAVSGETIEAQQHNDPLEDLATDANAARPIVAGGTGATSKSAATTALEAVSYGSAQTLTSGQKSQVQSNIGVTPFPSGTRMLFQQTTPPTGWTKDTTHNDKALRLVSGTVSTGGTTAFTTVFTSRTPAGSLGTPTTTDAVDNGAPGTNVAAQNHGHTFTGTAMDFSVQYVDVVVAEKD